MSMPALTLKLAPKGSRPRLGSAGGKRYAAARVDRMTGAWLPVNTSDINPLIAASMSLVRARVQQLVRDFPPFASAVAALVDFVIGTGIRFHSQAWGADDKPDKKLCQKIEDRWNLWCEQADVAGKMHLFELQQLKQRQMAENGESLIAFVRPRNRNRHPLALQMIEPGRLTDFQAFPDPRGVTNVSQGIEFYTDTGEILAYHIQPNDPGRMAQPVRFPAEDCLHHFKQIRCGQLRGISPFTPGILLANDLSTYVDAEIDGAKLAAKYVVMVETPDPTGFQDLRAQTDEDGKRIEELENGIIEYLRPGEKVNLSSHNRPGQTFEPFTRFILHLISSSVGVPYELVTGDYKEMTYSVLRGVRMDFKRRIDASQTSEIAHFNQPIFRRWMDAEVMAGTLDLPGYWTSPERYQRGLWIAPGMPSVDPEKENRANADAIRMGIKSPQQVCRETGTDEITVLDDFAHWQELCEERGLSFESTLNAISSAAANNPASIADPLDKPLPAEPTDQPAEVLQ